MDDRRQMLNLAGVAAIPRVTSSTPPPVPATETPLTSFDDETLGLLLAMHGGITLAENPDGSWSVMDPR